MQLAVVAAGFSPGESDQLRRAMAAWKRKGGARALREAAARRHAREAATTTIRRADLQADPGLRRIRLSGIAFGELRAAGLRLVLAQALRAGGVHLRAAQFAADGLLFAVAAHPGSAPARRECIRRRPMSCISDVGLQLSKNRRLAACGCARRQAAGQPQAESVRRPLPRLRDCSRTHQPALRLGLCLVKGLSEAGAKRLVARAGTNAPSTSVAIWRSARSLNRARHGSARRSGRAGVAQRTSPQRAVGRERRRAHAGRCSRIRTIATPRRVLEAPSEGEDIVADYSSLGLTLGAIRWRLLRERLQRQRMRRRRNCASLPHGRIARVTGLVTGRQRPGTASGVTFVTLEDETGMINVIVWRDLAERQRKELLRSNLLTVYGRWRGKAKSCT